MREFDRAEPRPGEDIRDAFEEVSEAEARQLLRGLRPFRREGSWIDALCRRLETTLLLSSGAWPCEWSGVEELWHDLAPIE